SGRLGSAWRFSGLPDPSRELNQVVPSKIGVTWAPRAEGEFNPSLITTLYPPPLFFPLLHSSPNLQHLRHLHARLLDASSFVDAVLLTAMLAGYAQHGELVLGFDVFKEMVGAGVMGEQLEEAERLIKEMPMDPDAAVLDAILAACRVHNNVDVGGRIAKRLIRMSFKMIAFKLDEVIIHHCFTKRLQFSFCSVRKECKGRGWSRSGPTTNKCHVHLKNCYCSGQILRGSLEMAEWRMVQDAAKYDGHRHKGGLLLAAAKKIRKVEEHPPCDDVQTSKHKYGPRKIATCISHLLMHTKSIRTGTKVVEN
ncbi:hypothetical protein Tsubulata_015414, partial [Turnera subulata]